MEDNKRVTLDIKQGSIITPGIIDIVELTGIYESKDSPLVKEVQLLLYPKGKDPAIKRNIPYDGYNFSMFLANFNGDDTEEIMIRGGYGTSLSYEIADVIDYKDGILVDVFNQDIFNNNVRFITKYLNNYKVLVTCDTMNEEYTVDISKNPSQYLSQVYDSNGKVKGNITPTVSNINSVYPIKSIYDNTYSLFIRQRVWGVSIEDKIGIIESFVDLSNDKINIIGMGMYLFGDKINGSTTISSNRELNNNKNLENYKGYIKDNKLRHIHSEFYNCTLEEFTSPNKITTYINEMCNILNLGEFKDRIFTLNSNGNALTLLFDYGQLTVFTDFEWLKVNIDIFTNLKKIDIYGAFSYISSVLNTDNYIYKENLCDNKGFKFKDED